MGNMDKNKVSSMLVISASLLAGLSGGFVGNRMGQTPSQRAIEGVIRCRRFELLDERGRTISFWGINQDNYAVLAFGSRLNERAGAASGGETRMPKIDNSHGEYLAIGVVDDSPFLDLKGSDGETRMNLAVTGYNKPIVWMGDESGPRLHLGVMMSDTPGLADNNWGLSLEPDRAFLGMLTRQKGQHRFVRGSFTVDKGEREVVYKSTK